MDIANFSKNGEHPGLGKRRANPLWVV